MKPTPPKGNADLPRDIKTGQFRRSGSPSIKKQRHAKWQKVYRYNLNEFKHRVHEGYLHCFCVLGERRNRIPISRSNSPLTSVFNELIKDEYRLGSNLQLQNIRKYCRRTLTLVRENMLPSWNNIISSKHDKSCKGFRLPSITRDTEMSKVHSWLTWASSEGVLAVLSVEDGIKACERAVATHFSAPNAGARPGRAGENSPNLTHPTVQSFCPNCECDGRKASRASAEGNESRAGNAESRNEQNGDAEQEVLDLSMSGASRGETNSDHFPQHPLRSPGNERRMTLRKDVFESAKDDNTYLSVCLLFDDTMELEFGCFSGMYLNEYKSRNIEPPDMLKEVFLYSQHKRFSGETTQELIQRENELRRTRLLLEKARVSLSLPIYEEMKWGVTDFFRNQQSTEQNNARAAQEGDTQS